MNQTRVQLLRIILDI